MAQLDIGAVLKRVFTMYRQHFAILFALALVVNLISAAAPRDNLAILLVGLLISIVLSTVYLGFATLLVDDSRDGRRDASVGQLLSSVIPAVVPLILVSLLFGIAFTIGLLLLVVPGLILLTIWSVVSPVVLLERTGVIAAFGRSRALVRGNGWPVFGVFVAVFVMLTVVFVVVVIVAVLVGGETITSGGGISNFLLVWLLGSFISPFTALVTPVLYFALRDGTAGSAEPTVPDSEWPETYAPPSAGT